MNHFQKKPPADKNYVFPGKMKENDVPLSISEVTDTTIL
jgi:hypothetical protein